MFKVDHNTLVDALANFKGTILPIRFKPTTSLSYAVNNVAAFYTTSEDESEHERLMRWTKELVAETNDLDVADVDLNTHMLNLEEVDAVAKAMGKKVADTAKQIKVIKGQIGGITEKIEARIDELKAKDATLAAHAKVKETTLEVFGWEFLGSIVDIANAEGDVERKYITGELDLNTTARIKLVAGKVVNDVEARLAPFKLSIGNLQDLSEKVVAEDDTLTENGVRGFMEFISKPRAVKSVIHTLVDAKSKAVEDVDCSVRLLSDIKDYAYVVDKVVGKMQIPDEVISTICSNIGALEDLSSICKVLSAHHRDNTFTDALVLPNGKINSDLRDSAITAGVTDTDVNYYITERYSKVQIPKMGIRIDHIEPHVMDLREKASNKTATSATIVADRINQIRQNMFMFVTKRELPAYLEEAGMKRERSQLESLITSSAKRMVRADASIDGTLWDIFMNTMYKGTMVETVVDRIGPRLANLAEQGEVTDPDIAKASAATYMRLVGDFIVNNFVEEDI